MSTMLTNFFPTLTDPGPKRQISSATESFSAVKRSPARSSFRDALKQSGSRETNAVDRQSPSNSRAKDAQKRTNSAANAQTTASKPVGESPEPTDRTPEDGVSATAPVVTEASPANTTSHQPEVSSQALTLQAAQPAIVGQGTIDVQPQQVAREIASLQQVPTQSQTQPHLLEPLSIASPVQHVQADAEASTEQIIRATGAGSAARHTLADARADVQLHPMTNPGAQSINQSDATIKQAEVIEEVLIRTQPKQSAHSGAQDRDAPDSMPEQRIRPLLDPYADRRQAEPAQPVQQSQSAARTGAPSSQLTQITSKTDEPAVKVPSQLQQSAKNVSTADQILSVKMSSNDRVPSDARAAGVNETLQFAQTALHGSILEGGSAPSSLLSSHQNAATMHGTLGQHVDLQLALDDTLRGAVEDPKAAERIVRGMTTLINAHGGAMNMRLNPPELGDLRVQMSIVRGLVTAQFHVTTPEAHAMVERNLTVLRQSLEQHGLTVDRLSVQTHLTSNSTSMSPDRGDQQQQQQSSQQHDAGEGRSRGYRDGTTSDQHRDSSRQQFARFAQDLTLENLVNSAGSQQT